MSAELVLAAIGTADLAIKYGKSLIALYSSFKNATTEIGERILLMETNWLRTEKQLDFLKRIWDKLDDDHQAIQLRILRLLIINLESAIEEVGKLGHTKKKGYAVGSDGKAGPEYKRWRYAFVKKGLDATIASLEKWQRAFDPTWFLILRMSDALVDVELAKVTHSTPSVSTPASPDASITSAKTIRDSLRPEDTSTRSSIFLPAEGISSSTRTPIQYSTACLLQRGPKNMIYILDSVQSLPEANPAVQDADVRDLARKLANADPLKFRLLQCRGVVKVLGADKKISSYDFVFHIPPSLRSPPQSLRKILIDAKPDISLSTRFHIAQQLAQSLSYVHTYGFVHKGIRPETVLIFPNQNGELASLFLLGFEKFRPAQPGRTLRAGDDLWQKELYRHPRRQGLRPEDEYVMQHDIYSLGVCLLEIGLWQTLVVHHPGSTVINTSLRELSIGDQPIASSLLPTLKDHNKDKVKNASLVKDCLAVLAKRELPSRMGDKYTDIVTSCLTCLDETNADFSDESEFKDEDGITIGVRYIEKVIIYQEPRWCG
ncbi:HET-s/LopB domain protein [Paraphoma chrysanthemicola]|nr:HET-s/LopB domain protein [Paraphoma chrysanthemicola]